MSCNKGRVAPTNTTKLRLFADSGGYCQNPKCLSELFRNFGDRAIHIAEIAHIISAGDQGPRSNPETTPEERSTHDNLLLLCPTCHTIVDKAEDEYSEQLILKWKEDHRRRISEQFYIKRYLSREESREALFPLLYANKTIFNEYGPSSEERFNPESSLPRQWIRKIRTLVIPNNRKILEICDANKRFLTGEELEVVEAFRQHIDDFEAKHLGGSPDNGRQFPVEMNQLFS